MIAVCKRNRRFAVRRFDNRSVRRNQPQFGTVVKIGAVNRLPAQFQRERRIGQLKRVSRLSLVGVIRSDLGEMFVVAVGNRRLVSAYLCKPRRPPP